MKGVLRREDRKASSRGAKRRADPEIKERRRFALDRYVANGFLAMTASARL
jgi:hypothetical protein